MASFFKKFFSVFDSLEFVVVVVFATLLFGAIVFGAWSGIKESGNVLALVAFSLLIIASIAGSLRDIYRKKFSAISIAITCFWVLCALYVIYKM